MTRSASGAHLFSPLTLRGITLRNRIVAPPMQQYSASAGGLPSDWHREHFGRLSLGGAALVFSEALAVAPEGRITHADLGLWNDDQGQALESVVKEIERNSAVPGAQLAHSGRKGGVRVPWEGFGPLQDSDAMKDQPPWTLVSPTTQPVSPDHAKPHRLERPEIDRTIEQFAVAASRAARAGFQVLEVHAGHGYLVHSFLSPIINNRDDEYGYDFAGRTRIALEIARAIRTVWPKTHPLCFRLSCDDEAPGGWSIDDTIKLARMLSVDGVDLIDCSSGGLVRSSMDGIKRENTTRLSIASQVRTGTPISTIAVGGITSPRIADAAVRTGQTDLVAIGREMLWNPFWALQAGCELHQDPTFTAWPVQYGWSLRRRQSRQFKS